MAAGLISVVAIELLFLVFLLAATLTGVFSVWVAFDFLTLAGMAVTGIVFIRGSQRWFGLGLLLGVVACAALALTVPGAPLGPSP